MNAQEKFLKKMNLAVKTLQKKTTKLWQKYNKDLAPTKKAYNKVRAAADKKYNLVHEPAWAERQRTIEPALTKLSAASLALGTLRDREIRKVRAEYYKIRKSAIAELQRKTK